MRRGHEDELLDRITDVITEKIDAVQDAYDWDSSKLTQEIEAMITSRAGQRSFTMDFFSESPKAAEEQSETDLSDDASDDEELGFIDFLKGLDEANEGGQSLKVGARLAVPAPAVETDQDAVKFSALFGALLQTPLQKVSDADPATLNLLALYYAKQKKQAGEFPVAFSAGLAGVKFAEREGRVVVELSDNDGTKIGEIDLTQDLEKLQTSGIAVEKAVLQSGAPVEVRAEEAAAMAREFARIHRLAVRGIRDIGDKLTTGQPLILKVAVGAQTGEAQRTLLNGSRTIIAGLFKDVAIEFVKEDGSRAENFESDSRVEEFAKLANVQIAYISETSMLATIKTQNASAVFLEKAQSEDVFAYTAIMISAIMVRRLDYKDLGDLGTQLINSLIGGGVKIGQKEFDAMKSPAANPNFDFSTVLFKKLGRIPVDQIMQGARMALSAIGASA
jgi:hypothetical protein